MTRFGFVLVALNLFWVGLACTPTVHQPGTLFGARYREPNVQIFSLGRGRLPTGEGSAAYLHLRVAVANTANSGDVRVDPREQVLWVAKRAMLPAFADSEGKPGIVHVPPRRKANLDLFYRMTADIEDAVFAWQLWNAEGKALSERLGMQALQASSEAAELALWVPKGQDEQSYEIRAIERWAEPSHRWYWWRESDFPAWSSGVVRIGPEPSAPSSSLHLPTWYWFDDPSVEVWPSVGPIGGTGAGGAHVAAREAGSMPPRGRSGWRRVLRAPPSPAPASGLKRVEARSPAVESGQDNEPSTYQRSRFSSRARATSEAKRPPASPPSAPRKSTPSSVGRSWRAKGR